MSLTLQQVAEHNSSRSCWVIINSNVYDVTDFLAEHPGGAQVILRYAGKDATAAYEPIHPPDALDKNLSHDKHLGKIDQSGALAIREQQERREKTPDEIRVEKAQRNKPPLSQILSLKDMEGVAREVLPFKALAYYASASDDETTLVENARAFARFFFNARVLRPISKFDTSTTMLGFRTRIPVFVSGSALARLGHPLGEANITRGAGKMGIIQMVSSNSSLSAEEITRARIHPSQPLFFQLYKHKDNSTAAQRVRDMEGIGYNAIFLTVDAPVPGNRERDIKVPFVLANEELEAKAAKLGKTAGELRAAQNLEEDEEIDSGGTAGGLLKNDDIDMTWTETIPWLRSVTRMPIVIKGIQCVEDAVLAAEAGVDGILISNHGGRQLDYSMPSIEVLYRLRKQRPDVFDKLEVFVDGGIRRGTDVLKALCLGARGVGLGRPFLYAQSAYGEAGVVKIVKILEREIITGMRLLGARSISELVPEMVERVDWQPLTSKL